MVPEHVPTTNIRSAPQSTERQQPPIHISFDNLCQLLRRLGFEERSRGSHHIFRKSGVEEKINLQRDNGKAKAYQVRQVRTIIVKHGMGEWT